MAENLNSFPFKVRPNQPNLNPEAVLVEAREVVGQDLSIDFVETPKNAQFGAVVLRGRLLRPSEEVFARWLTDFNRRGYTPVLQPDPEDSSPGAVVLRVMQGAIKPVPGKPIINLVLFVVTLFSTFFTGALYGATDLENLSDIFQPQNLLSGWPFALTLIGILSAHEFGHYFAARYHKVAVSLPFFLPLPPPLSFIGTLGAFIRLKEPIPDRRKLFDIGVAGPLAGLVLALPLLFIGLSTSAMLVPPPMEGAMLEGNSILYYFAKIAVFGKALPNAITGEDVMMNQVTFAAWIGLLVTALNLLPVGQLDGGHTVFALLGNRARFVNITIMIVMAILGCLGLPVVQAQIPGLENIGYAGWFVWLGLIFFLIGPYHPPPLDDVTQLDARRRWLGYLVILIFILIFTPVPFRLL